MLRLPAFRELVVRRLTDTSAAEVGVVTQIGDDVQTRQFAWREGSSQGPTPSKNETVRRQSLRLCDRAAIALQRLAGAPRFEPFASVAERDRQCAAIAAYLHRYGAAFGRINRSAIPLYRYYDAMSFDYFGPVFAVQNHPATEADVRANRAIFSLDGKNVRIVSGLPAPFPIEAQWTRDPDADDAWRSDGKRIPWSRGYIWQAEEVFDGRNWVRYYGYVGPHSVVKVPASQIQITDYRATRNTQAATPGTTTKPE
jgi:hypothetical protein